MPKIELEEAPVLKGSSYPPPFDVPCRNRSALRLGLAAGLTQFGVNLVTLPPGAWSSQRHWHAKEDELVYVLSGEVVLVEDEGETVLGPGDCAAWKAGVRNGHHLVNRSSEDARLLVVGTRDDTDWGEYPDIDLRFGPALEPGGGPAGRYTHKDGTPY
ncbi:MAG TPA: cupin domain-containing protein [Gammaproteobacteria bacterium]